MFAEHLGEDIDKKVCLECQRQFTGIVAACPHDGTTLVTLARDPMIGTCLMGKYDIIDVIGHGGMGVVYKGRQVLMERVVAIKMLQSQHIADSMSVKRFHQEGKASSKLNHPHVITVYDFGVTPNTGQPFIVMDFLSGISLADMIKQEGQVSVERSVKILAQSTDALDHAHRMGVIHRDLKPSNIMLIEYEDEKDYVKVVDFGVAKLITAGGEQQKLTQMGEVCGSPVYMSPEQVQGLELDNRSDIYSMGVVIYETLTGRLPILGKTMVETMSKHITEMPPRFGDIRPDLYIPERLEAVVFKAMAKSPDDRHQTMAELTRDLETAIPRAGKSQVLRSDFPQMPTLPNKDEHEGNFWSGFGLMHWVAIATSAIALICIIGFIIMSNKPVANTSLPSAPTTAVTTPAGGTGSSTAPGHSPASGGQTASTAPANSSPAGGATTAVSTPPTATVGGASTNTAAANPSSSSSSSSSSTASTSSTAPAAAHPATNSASSTTANGNQSDESTSRNRSKSTTTKLAHKPKHHAVAAEPTDEVPMGNSGAAASYIRRHSASAASASASASDPFKSLKDDRGYK